MCDVHCTILSITIKLYIPSYVPNFISGTHTRYISRHRQTTTWTCRKDTFIHIYIWNIVLVGRCMYLYYIQINTIYREKIDSIHIFLVNYSINWSIYIHIYIFVHNTYMENITFHSWFLFEWLHCCCIYVGYSTYSTHVYKK